MFSNDLATALAAETKLEWYAPIVTIHFDQGATKYTKVDGAKLEIET